MYSPAFSTDIRAAASAAFFVAAIDLDGGRVYLSDRPGTVGDARLLGAVLSWESVGPDGGSFTADLAGLLSTVTSTTADLLAFQRRYGFWLRRRAEVWEVLPGAASIYEGRRIFTGIVGTEPGCQDGVLSLTLAEPLVRPVLVPSGSPIDVSAWPQATDQALGKYPPVVYGTVEEAELLPVAQPASTSLTDQVDIGTNAITVADASKFTASGAVWIDGRTYPYSSRTDTTLLGMTIAAPHKSGTLVAQVGPWKFLAAGHPVAGITGLTAQGTTSYAVAGGAVDLSAATVTFDAAPSFVSATERYNASIEFDRVAASSFNQTYSVDYTIRSQSKNAAGDDVIYYSDLDVAVIPPQTVTAWTYVFTVYWVGAIDQSTDNPGAYSPSLGGVTFSIDKFGGSRSVSVPVTAGTPLRLHHMVNGGYAPTLPRISRIDVTWAAPAIAKPAINAVNAIQAVTATITQSASVLPTVTSAATGNIVFARPNADHIIDGAYTVAFTVTGGFAGHASVEIGGKVLWVTDGGAVIFNASGSTWQLDDDADAVAVEVDQPGLTVTVTAASRTVLTGHTGTTDWATLQWPNNTVFQADQTTDNPDRGQIAKARLVVEWFTTDALTGTVPVTFGGVALGNLSRDSVAGQTVSHTIAIDKVTQGAAAFKASDISTVVGGGTTIISNAASVISQTIPMSYTQTPVSNLFQGACVFSPPPFVIAGVHTAVVTCSANGNYSSTTGYGGVFDSIPPGTSIFNMVNSRQFNVKPSTSYTTGVYIASSGQTNLVGFSHTIFGSDARVESVTITWNVDKIAASNTPAYGSTSVNNNALPNSGIGVSLTGGNISITIPSPPQTTVQTFDLPWVTKWSDLTNKTVRIEYLNGSAAASVCLVRCYLSVEYDMVTRQPAGTSSAPLVATVAGLSGNPADIMADLAARTGQRLDLDAHRLSADYFAANGWSFARRVSDQTEATTLLQRAADQALCLLARTPHGLEIVRRLDLSRPMTPIADADLLDPAQIAWVDPDNLYNEVSLAYREIGASTTRALVVNAASGDRWAKLGSQQMGGETQTTNPDALWIASDSVAALFAAGFLRLNAPMRRVLTLPLHRGDGVAGNAYASAFSLLEPGDLVRYLPLGILARVTAAPKDGAGCVTVTAEEIPEVW